MISQRAFHAIYPGMPATLAAGVGYTFTNAEAAALVARFTTPPTNARKALIDTLIGSLKTAGVWTKLDALYVMAAADSQAARRNWVQDLYNLTAVASPTFTIDRGYAGDGSSSYLRTSLLTNSPGIKRLQDDNHLSVWSLSDISIASGTDIGFTETLLRARDGSAIFTRNQFSGSVESIANASSLGHFVNTRPVSTSYDVYRNAISLGNKVVTSGSTIARETGICARGTNVGSFDNFTNRQYAAASIGGALTAQNVTDLYAALNTYLTAVGAV